MARQQKLRETSMNATTARVESAGRFVPRCAAGGRGERLANWLALITLLALGIVWQ
jgi:hypothetical protein